MDTLEPGDVDDLTKKVKSLISDSRLRQRMGKAGRAETLNGIGRRRPPCCATCSIRARSATLRAGNASGGSRSSASVARATGCALSERDAGG